MSRDEQEMALWAAEYSASSWLWDADRAAEADAAVAEFRKRYPPQSEAPAAVWYDEPPFAKNGKSHPCWVDGCAVHGDVYWLEPEWRVFIVGSAFQHPLAGRRVCPIVKPQEPPQ